MRLTDHIVTLKCLNVHQMYEWRIAIIEDPRYIFFKPECDLTELVKVTGEVMYNEINLFELWAHFYTSEVFTDIDSFMNARDNLIDSIAKCFKGLPPYDHEIILNIPFPVLSNDDYERYDDALDEAWVSEALIEKAKYLEEKGIKEFTIPSGTVITDVQLSGVYQGSKFNVHLDTLKIDDRQDDLVCHTPSKKD